MIVDRAHEESNSGQNCEVIPNVRSTAAARARAGEYYRPSVPPMAPVPVVKPSAAAIVPVPPAPVVSRIPAEPDLAYAEPAEPEALPSPPIFETFWSALRAKANAVLDSFPRVMQSSD